MIKIRTTDLESIVSHCKEHLPIEACGVLAGKVSKVNGVVEKEVLKVFHCRNELNSSIEYRIGAEEQIKTFSEIEDMGFDLLGFYHSHPNNSAKPSATDREKGNYYGYSYLIVAFHPTQVSSWTLEEKAVFKEEAIQLI